MGSKTGTVKAAAKRLGLHIEEYNARRKAGLKHCTKCKTWTPMDCFAQDSTRGDGRKAKCRDCDRTRQTPGPTKQERQLRRLDGQGWCRRCQDWLPLTEIRGGLCRQHTNEAARERYESNPSYRAERRQHAHSRKRDVKPMPYIGQSLYLEMFGGACAYCGAPATTWDHVHPVSRGGDTTPNNIVPACAVCNASKGDRDVHEWLAQKGIEPSALLIEWLCFTEETLPT